MKRLFVALVAITFSTNIARYESILEEKKSSGTTKYGGEKFPVEYFEPDVVQPSVSDLNVYLETLIRTIEYFLMLNDTDINIAVGSYLCKGKINYI